MHQMLTLFLGNKKLLKFQFDLGTTKPAAHALISLTEQMRNALGNK